MNMSKICKKCGKYVNDNVKFCPECKSQSFKTVNELTLPGNTQIHTLFYWNYDGKYVLSKTKISTALVFIICILLSITSKELFLFSFILAIITFMLGVGLHQLLSKPNINKIKHNDYGLGEDLRHLFFYWQNNEGEYVLSKTKITSIILGILCSTLGLTLNPPNLIAVFVFGLLFGTPIFAIGYGIHRLVNPNPQLKQKPAHQVNKVKQFPPNAAEPKNEINPAFIKYNNQLDELKREFDLTESQTYELIEKRFEPPQITYNRFCSVVDKFSKLFNAQLSSARSIIKLSSEYSPKIENELNSRINLLESIINKLDDLKNELVVTIDESNPEDINNLFNEMHELIDSVKDY